MRSVLFAALATLLCIFDLGAQSVSVLVRVVDQYGAEIAGSLFRDEAHSGSWAVSGSIAPFDVGTATLRIAVAAPNGYPLSLERFETVSITPSTTELSLEWIVMPVTLRLTDQHGAEIPSSYLWISRYGGSVPSVPTGTTMRLPITDESVYPTMFGAEKDGYQISLNPGAGYDVRPGSPGYPLSLFRNEFGNEVTAATTEFVFEWIVSPVRLRLRDQHGAEIPTSYLWISRYGGSIPSAPTGSTMRLPITDESVYPTMFGAEKDGYQISLNPGAGYDVRPGNPGYPLSLFRNEFGNEVTAATTEFVFEWIVVPVALRLVDQTGVEIPSSFLWISRYGGSIPSVPTGSTMRLPITDESVYPTMFGAEKSGYQIDLTPGVRYEIPSLTGVPLAELNRRETGAEVSAATTEVSFEWIVVDCTMQVLDQNAYIVPGSSAVLGHPYSLDVVGLPVRLPITENAVYAGIYGPYADGYPIVVSPGDEPTASLAAQFEVLASGGLIPETFEMSGRTYSLGCSANAVPAVDAGENRSILTSQIQTTVIGGTASDADGQPLIYRWLEGAAVLYGPVAVSGSGDAPLQLSTTPSLGIGAHELTLEVTDGIATSMDTMTLTIGNAPPDASCTGSGTYEAGVDAVVLGGSVADFDGDTITWSWWNGTVLLASGSLATNAGGAPVDLPEVTLTTGTGTGALGTGTYSMELRVDDGASTPVTCDASVVVNDSLTPRLAPVSDRTVLWPPNHQMVTITIAPNASDASGGPVLFEVEVRSSEDALKDGSGNTIPDFGDPVIDYINGRIYVDLRAERAGKGPGRTYTITVTAIDVAGNRSSADVRVVAPHDRGK